MSKFHRFILLIAAVVSCPLLAESQCLVSLSRALAASVALQKTASSENAQVRARAFENFLLRVHQLLAETSATFPDPRQTYSHLAVELTRNVKSQSSGPSAGRWDRIVERMGPLDADEIAALEIFLHSKIAEIDPAPRFQSQSAGAAAEGIRLRTFSVHGDFEELPVYVMRSRLQEQVKLVYPSPQGNLIYPVGAIRRVFSVYKGGEDTLLVHCEDHDQRHKLWRIYPAAARTPPVELAAGEVVAVHLADENTLIVRSRSAKSESSEMIYLDSGYFEPVGIPFDVEANSFGRDEHTGELAPTHTIFLRKNTGTFYVVRDGVVNVVQAPHAKFNRNNFQFYRPRANLGIISYSTRGDGVYDSLMALDLNSGRIHELKSHSRDEDQGNLLDGWEHVLYANAFSPTEILAVLGTKFKSENEYGEVVSYYTRELTLWNFSTGELRQLGITPNLAFLSRRDGGLVSLDHGGPLVHIDRRGQTFEIDTSASPVRWAKTQSLGEQGDFFFGKSGLHYLNADVRQLQPLIEGTVLTASVEWISDDRALLIIHSAHYSDRKRMYSFTKSSGRFIELNISLLAQGGESYIHNVASLGSGRSLIAVTELFAKHAAQNSRSPYDSTRVQFFAVDANGAIPLQDLKFDTHSANVSAAEIPNKNIIFVYAQGELSFFRLVGEQFQKFEPLGKLGPVQNVSSFMREGIFNLALETAAGVRFFKFP